MGFFKHFLYKLGCKRITLKDRVPENPHGYYGQQLFDITFHEPNNKLVESVYTYITERTCYFHMSYQLLCISSKRCKTITTLKPYLKKFFFNFFRVIYITYTVFKFYIKGNEWLYVYILLTYACKLHDMIMFRLLHSQFAVMSISESIMLVVGLSLQIS